MGSENRPSGQGGSSSSPSAVAEIHCQSLDVLVRDAAVGMAVLTGPEYRYSMANAAYMRFARGKGDIIGRTVAEVWPEVFDAAKPILDRVYTTGEAYSAVDSAWSLRRDAQPEEAYLTFSLTRIYDDSSQDHAMLTIVQDTTEYVLATRRAAEAAAEAAAGFSELEAVIQSIDQGIVIADAGGALVRWNAKAVEIGIVPEGPPADKRLDDLARAYELSELDGAKIFPERWPLARALRGEVFSGWEMRLRPIDGGDARAIACGGTSLKGRDGGVALAVVTVQDVTERKRAEEALRESEAGLRLAAEAANMGTWHWDLARGEFAWDEKCKTLFGLPPDSQMSYDVFLATAHPEDRARVDEAVRAVLFKRKDLDVEYRVVWPDDAVRVIMAKGRAWYDDGKPLVMVGIAVDVTERRGVEEALRLSEERFHVALKSVATAVMSHDRDLRYTWVYQPMNGFQPEDLIGKRDDEVAPPADIMEVVAFKRAALETGKFMRRETRLTVRGKEYVYDMAAEPIRDASGRTVGLIVAATDITARRKAEDELAALKETLDLKVAERTARLRALAAELAEGAEREKRRLAGALHDGLQQLLVAARMRTASMKAAAPDDAARKSAEEVDDLMRQSIDASRSLGMELSPPALYGGMVAAVRWFADWFRDKYAMEVAVDADDKLEEPPERVRLFLLQAVRDLLCNVVKHAKTQKAKVSLRRLEEGRLSAEVVDDGAGFDATAAVTAQRGGFGLLSIRERLELMGGEMEVESAPGRGTRVALVIPAYAPPSPAPRRPKATARHKEGKIRVLLADDHKILREGLAQLLRAQADMEVVAEAADGREALNLAREKSPDVVVMDVNLPEISGIEATRRIKADLPDVRIVGLSMYEDRALVEKMRDAGASAYVAKGGPSQALIDAIRGKSPAPA